MSLNVTVNITIQLFIVLHSKMRYDIGILANIIKEFCFI